jgi:outer membrane receptor protein involved in Fe transport
VIRPRPLAPIAVVVAEVLAAAAVGAPPAVMGPPAGSQAATPAILVGAIPARPLKEALTAFADQTGLQLVYVSGIVRGQKSHRVRAGLSPERALAKLLQGTGVRYEYLTPNTIRILANTPKQSLVPADSEPEEIIVTASRREESVQNVPITIQVMTERTLANLNAATFEEFVGYLPGVTAHGVGPNQNNIYVRGLGAGQTGIQGSGFIETFSSVAVYLDEQSVQVPGRNLDIYTADLERIEVLEGPQGTLFGAGAEAGVLR